MLPEQDGFMRGQRSWKDLVKYILGMDRNTIRKKQLFERSVIYE